ncbi:hypothetical protein EV702DRAFT_1224418 [Suillus placidus]|uniref:Uncharacterized protein n=1 Tax=Suillus placidus TaxID=48579 RepID=A0A9P7A6J6_9AGAM|nr:hypothetical protein EV702DRAFT_1224418 [Suillus placidus]
METPSSFSSTITAPPDCHETTRIFAKLSAEAMTCQSALLHYDSVSKSMIEWCWPDDDEGKKVPLLNFEKYRNKHKFRYPCCLCASSSGRQYTEAAVYPWRDMVTNKTCCKNRQILSQIISSYLELPSLSAIVLLMDCLEEHEEPYPIQMEWTWREQAELMMKLGSSIGNGITGAEFRVLFRRCKLCMQVGVRPMMNRHIAVCSGGVQKRRHGVKTIHYR